MPVTDVIAWRRQTLKRIGLQSGFSDATLLDRDRGMFTRYRDWRRVPKGIARSKTNYYVDQYSRIRFGSDDRVFLNPWPYSYSPKVPCYKHSGQLDFNWNSPSFSLVKSGYDTSTSLAVAQNKALRKAAGATWNIPVFAAEAGKTIDMIASTASRLAGAYSALRKGNLAKLADNLGIRTPRKASGNWLEYRYGWQPLLMDIKDAAEFAASKTVDEPQIQHFSAIDKRENVTLWRNPSFSGEIDTNGPTVVGDILITRYTECRAWIRCRVKGNDSYRTLSQAGITNPAAVAWELIPYSFVADWFIQVGDFLELQTALSGLEVLDAGYSTCVGGDTTALLRLNPDNSATSYAGSVTGPSLEYRRYTRTAWASPKPNLIVQPKLNISRVADAAALIYQVFSKR